VSERGVTLVRSLRARPFRALAGVALLALAGVTLAATGLNLWAWYQFREAESLAERQRFARAYEHYARCLRVWRGSAPTHLLAARAARRAGRYQEAEEHLAECAKLRGPSGDAFPLALERLLLQAQSGDLGEVEEVLWGYVERGKPEAPLILEAMARGYTRMFRMGTALRCLEMLLERQPDNVEGLFLRGWIREGGGKPQEAGKDYRRALEVDPERDDARLGLARILLGDSPREALAHFERVVAHQPDNPEALMGLAEARLALGEPEKARPVLEDVLAKDPGNSRALTALGALAVGEGDRGEGEALLRKAIATDPGNVDAHYQLYLCLVQQRGREKEAAAQRKAHDRVKADRERLAQIAGKEMTRSPNDPNLHYEMGAIYLRYGKPEVGVRWLHSALKLDPTHQPSHRALYEYFKRTGRAEEAEQHRRQLRPGTGEPAPARP
jgi:tetratricopeptide (TPR) repeat protein